MRIKLKELRTERGWTQAETAIRSGVSLDYIRSLEIGRSSPSLKIAFQLKSAFGCSCIDEMIEHAV